MTLAGVLSLKLHQTVQVRCLVRRSIAFVIGQKLDYLFLVVGRHEFQYVQGFAFIPEDKQIIHKRYRIEHLGGLSINLAMQRETIINMKSIIIGTILMNGQINVLWNKKHSMVEISKQSNKKNKSLTDSC